MVVRNPICRNGSLGTCAGMLPAHPSPGVCSALCAWVARNGGQVGRRKHLG